MKLRYTAAVTLPLVLISALMPVGAWGDVIVLKDATSIEVYNVEKAGKWILYTLEDSADSPLQRIAAEKVFAIKDSSGELQSIDDKPEQAEVAENETDDGGPRLVESVPSEDNATLIALYNSPTMALRKPKGEKDKEKYCSDFLTIWGITSGSVLSDENLRIDFIMTKPAGPAKKIIPQYKVKVTNKTGKPIYIDLANSFRFNADGSAKPYFTNSVYSEGNTSGKGASLNLGAVTGALGIGGPVGTLAGGVGIGAGSSKSASVTTSEERILMIPPMASVFMPPMKYVDGTSVREDYESLYIRTFPVGGALTADGDLRRYDANKGYVHMLEQDGGIDDARLTRDVLKAPLGHIRDFSEEDSPKQLKRIITYSVTPDFSTYSCIGYTMYVRGIMGSSQRWNVPSDYSTQYLQIDDEEHLLVGVGSVKK